MFRFINKLLAIRRLAKKFSDQSCEPGINDLMRFSTWVLDQKTTKFERRVWNCYAGRAAIYLDKNEIPHI